MIEYIPVYLHIDLAENILHVSACTLSKEQVASFHLKHIGNIGSY